MSSKKNMLKTAIMSIRAVVVMVRVMRGHGLLAIMTDDLSSHIQEVGTLLLQCRKCPMKHMKRIKERIRKAIPKDIPKTVVFGRTRICTMKMQKKIKQAQVT